MIDPRLPQPGARPDPPAAAKRKDASGVPSVERVTIETRDPSGRAVAGLKMKCVGCGVIESIRRIEVDEHVAGRCTIDETDQAQPPGLLDGAHRAAITPADTLPGALGMNDGGRKPKRATGYQIVVRFRDGTRHVFTETTPRTVRQGERILVGAQPRYAG